jgi:hypothetical protein
MMYCGRCGKPLEGTCNVCACTQIMNTIPQAAYFTTDALLVEIRNLLKDIRRELERMNQF